MFNTLSILIHLINSIFSGLYISQFLKSKLDKKLTISLWLVIYFALQVAIFDVLYSQYPFNNMVGAIINVILLIGIQLIFFRREISSQLFVSFSFVAGKEIVKYVVSVANFALGAFIGKWINALVIQGKIATDSHVGAANHIMVTLMCLTSTILYAAIMGIYLFLINKKYVRKEYHLQVGEIVFLILPSIAAICISITLRMMILTVENGTTALIFNTVPETVFWIPVICIMLLGAVIANVILFQNVVQYHEENRKRTLLENQVLQMQKEVQEIQDIYSDMRGLRHDLRGHINSIMQYVKKHNDSEDEELNGYVRNMEETVSKLDFCYQSGNPITDIIIHQKKQEADRAGIKFLVDFNYPKELQIDVYDIGIVLNNALENAIEAASLVEADRYISLHSYVKGNLFFMEVDNSFVRDIVMDKESGLPESSKADKKFHGMGLRSVYKELHADRETGC